MRVFICADIEGLAGVASHEQTEPPGIEYAEARRWMTDVAFTAARAAIAAGATEVIVADGHGNGQNILVEGMPSGVRLVRSWPRPLGMMQGIEIGRFDAAFLIGFHAGAMSPGGVLSHTLSGRVRSLEVNGVALDETLLAAAIAGHHAVPVALVSGDDVCTAGAARHLTGVATIVTKHAYGRFSALTISPEQECALLREAVPAALATAPVLQPFRIDGPLDVRLEVRAALEAEVLALLPMFERTGAFEVAWRSRDVAELAGVLEFIDQYDIARF